jgi:hypothetical protein
LIAGMQAKKQLSNEIQKILCLAGEENAEKHPW